MIKQKSGYYWAEFDYDMLYKCKYIRLMCAGPSEDLYQGKDECASQRTECLWWTERVELQRVLTSLLSLCESQSSRTPPETLLSSLEKYNTNKTQIDVTWVCKHECNMWQF